MARGAYFSGDEYLDSLYSRYGTDPSTDKDLQQNLVRLLDIRAKLYAGLNKGEIDRELRTLSEQVKMYKTARETAARVAETRAKSSRVTAQNLADVKIALDNNDRALALKLNAVSPAWGTAEQASRVGMVGGKPNVLSAASELAKWQDAQGRVLGEDSAEVAPTMNRLANMMFGQNLTEVTPEQMVTALGPSAPQTIKDFVFSRATAGKRRYQDMLVAQDQIQKDKSELDRIRQEVAAVAPGSSALNTRLADLADRLEPSLMAAMGRSAADIEAQRELTVNKNAELTKLDQDIDIARSRAYGTTKATADEKIGRLMATPQFKAWAEGNGYKIGDYNVDESGQLTMAPGQDDKAALRVFLYQAKRTDQKYGPLFADKSTGVLVRVTAQDPEQRAQVMDKYRSTDGSYYLDVNNELVKPGQARQELERGGFIPSVEVARAGKVKVFRMPDGSVVGADGKPAQVPAETKFFPAYVAGEDRKPQRYLTVGDVQGGGLAALKIGYDDGTNPEEKAALDAAAKGAPYRVADENTVQSSWTGVYTGYLDRPHARDALAGKTGMSTISLDGGQVRIPGDRPATIEVVKARDPGLVAGVVRAYNKLMPEQHLEKLRQEGVAVDRMTGMSLGERIKLGDEAFARFMAEPPAAPPAPTEAVTTVVTPGGQVQDVTLPIRSGATETAMREGRDLIPVGGGTPAPTAAPATTAAPTAPAAAPTTPAAAPAAKPAPAAAPSTAKERYVKSSDGYTFKVTGPVGGETYEIVAAEPGKSIPGKTTFGPRDAQTKQLVKNLKDATPVDDPTKAPAPKAEPKAAPSALPVAKKTTDVTAPAETGPEIGARQAAAVVVPRATKPTTDEQDMLALAEKLRKERETKAAAAPIAEKPSPAGEAFKSQPKPTVRGVAEEAIVKTATGMGQEGLDIMRRNAPSAYAEMMSDEARKLRRPRTDLPLKMVGEEGPETSEATVAPKPLAEKAPTPEEAARRAGETISRNREARFSTPKPNPFSFFKRKPGVRPVASELDTME